MKSEAVSTDDWGVFGHEQPTALPSEALRHLDRLADEVDRRESGEQLSPLIAEWAGHVAEAMGLDDEARVRCVAGGRFHDVGKAAIPDSILCKAGPLTGEDTELIRQHPEQGARLVGGVPELERVAEIVRAHHERYDGRGYPDGLAGEAIPVEARIVAVCDAWAGMRGARAFRGPLATRQAVQQLRGGAGSEFDPAVVDAFLHLLETGVMSDLPDEPVAVQAAGGL
jgi:HD-GYP domain-containing protein (c-di-GMP phosphodiesterase class II)